MAYPADPILRLHNITKTFAGAVALDGLTLSVAPGEIHAIYGANDAEKSALIRLISGVHPHGSYTGDIIFDGSPCRFRDTRDSERLGIAVFQHERASNPDLPITDDTGGGEELAHWGMARWTDTETSDMYEQIRLLVLDEPTATLDARDSALMLALIRQLKRLGGTCVVFSSGLSEIVAIADTTTVLRGGRTVATLDMHGPTPVTAERLVQTVFGGEMPQRYQHNTANTANIGQEVLHIEHWRVRHPNDDSRVVVDDVDLLVRRGEIVGIAGLIDAGRTELALSVFGRSWGTVTSGQLYLYGQPVTIDTTQAAIGHGIAYVAEDRRRWGMNLLEAIQRDITIAKFGRIALAGIVDLDARADECRHLGREPDAGKPGSREPRSREPDVDCLAERLAEPAVLILDEPTRGIDIEARHEVYATIYALALAGTAIVVISSDLSEMLGICDRIYAMSLGRVTGQLQRAEATRERLMSLMAGGRTG